MPEEQVQGQQTLEKADEADRAEEAEKVDTMREQREPEKNRVRPLRAAKAVPEQAPAPNRSYWPFALAIVLSIGLMGVVIYPIVFFIGMALTIIIIIAWSVDRR